MVTNVLRVESGKAHGTPGGVAIEVDGVELAGPQPVLDLLSTQGVGSTVAEDVPNESNDIVVNFDGMRLISTTSTTGAISTTTLFTVPGGELFTAELVIVRCTAITGTITSPPSAGVGFNGAADNIFASQILTGLTAAGKIYVFPIGGIQAEILAASVVSFGIDVAAIGGSMSISVDLIGRSA